MTSEATRRSTRRAFGGALPPEDALAASVPVIRLTGVTKVFGEGTARLEAVAGVDLQVARGEFLAIMGPSGSGKSTLMNIIGCLDRPTSGQYHLDGRDVARLNDDALADVRRLAIGFVFQTFNLLPRLTSLQNVELPMVYAGVPGRRRRQRAVELLESVGLGGRLAHRPNQLSGGERQRVAVARSMANEPSLLLADEPTGNLDSRSGAEIVALLEHLHDEGRTIVLITHEEEVAGHAQRVIHLKDGRIADDAAVGAGGTRPKATEDGR
ncbi:MAG: ABC transporter ATP-binding protein [Thermoleophilia bacterium]